jgi:exonuclease V gamma subunit
MTIPAPSASSTSTQQPGSSASASGQAPTIAHDTVTQGTSVTGLMGVFAERDARDVADKIAQAVRSYVQRHNQDSDQNKQIQEIRVTGDLSALSDINTLRILTSQATQLKD